MPLLKHSLFAPHVLAAVGAAVLFMCRIALAAWGLLLLTVTLIVAAVGLHLYQLRIQARPLFACLPFALLAQTYGRNSGGSSRFYSHEWGKHWR